LPQPWASGFSDGEKALDGLRGRVEGVPVDDVAAANADDLHLRQHGISLELLRTHEAELPGVDEERRHLDRLRRGRRRA